jgi:hypothetical protein
MTEKDAPPVIVDENEERTALRDEASALLELTKNKIKRDQTTPCPGCNILVPIKANDCPHCESNIAAHNALMRESLRRLDEIRAELDDRHDKLLEDRRNEEARPAVRERLKRFFSGAEPVDVPEVAARNTDGPRVLDTVSEGDQLKVLECDGSWLKVKTRDGRTGWVYSTFQKKP